MKLLEIKKILNSLNKEYDNFEVYIEENDDMIEYQPLKLHLVIDRDDEFIILN